MREYHFRKTGEGRVVRRVPRSRRVRAGLSFDWDWCLGVSDAERAEALLRERGFAFRDVQLFSQIALSWNEMRAGGVCRGTGTSPRGVRFPPGRVCGHAESC